MLELTSRLPFKYKSKSTWVRVHSKQGGRFGTLQVPHSKGPLKPGVIDLKITGLLEFFAKSELQVCPEPFVLSYRVMVILFSAHQQQNKQLLIICLRVPFKIIYFPLSAKL